MIASPNTDRPRPAVVAKTSHARERELYFKRTDHGHEWTEDPARATRFPSMHDAVRTAMRLPSGHRAYGLPWGGCGALPASTIH